MSHNSSNRSTKECFRMILMVALVTLGVMGGIAVTRPLQSMSLVSYDVGGMRFPGTEALTSTIVLQMPFIAGETWTVGGAGSFYGDGAHTNANNDYYATDWNRTNDNGAALLPVADGIVSDVVAPPNCLPPPSYGCYVRIDHANGYRTLYAHLSSALVANQSPVHTWDLIGKVGSAGLTDPNATHLHLTFRHLDNGGYYSHCNTATPPNTTCPNGENPTAPQGYRPNPMMTTLGPTILEDWQAYTSVNGRVYLPELRNNNNWTTRLYVRNNGTEMRSVTIHYFYPDGTPTPVILDTCGLGPNQLCPISVNEFNRVPAGNTASAFVDGGENVTVLAHDYNGEQTTEYGGLLAASAPTLQGWEQTGTPLYAPIIKNNYYSRSSTFLMANTNATGANATIQLYNASTGATVGTPTAYWVPGNGSTSVPATNCSPGLCSATLSFPNNQPLAVVIREQTADGYNASMHNPISVGTLRNFAPIIKKNYGGQTTSLTAQNVGTTTTAIQVFCYPSTGGSMSCGWAPNLPPMATAVFPLDGVQNNAFGSAVISSTGVNGNPAQPIVTLIYESGSPYELVTNAILTGTTAVDVPELYGNYGIWNSGLQVQNLGSADATVRVTYYWGSGQQEGLPQTVTIGPYQMQLFSANPPYDNLPDNFYGGAVITSTQPIAVVVNTAHTGTGDTKASYTGPNR